MGQSPVPVLNRGQIPLKKGLQVATEIQKGGSEPSAFLSATPRSSLSLQLAASCLRGFHSCETQLGRNKRARHRESAAPLSLSMASSRAPCPGQLPFGTAVSPPPSVMPWSSSHSRISVASSLWCPPPSPSFPPPSAGQGTDTQCPVAMTAGCVSCRPGEGADARRSHEHGQPVQLTVTEFTGLPVAIS